MTVAGISVLPEFWFTLKYWRPFHVKPHIFVPAGQSTCFEGKELFLAKCDFQVSETIDRAPISSEPKFWATFNISNAR